MSHLQAGIFGVAAGDALGVPYDGKKRDTFDVRTRTVNGARADTSERLVRRHFDDPGCP